MNQSSFLKGKNVLITRGEGDHHTFASSIAQYGGIPVTVSLIGFEPCTLHDVEKQMISSVDSYDWLIFTSKNGVDYFFREYKGLQLPKVAVIGKQTQKQLEQYGYRSSFVPAKFVAEEFVQEFLPVLKREERVLVVKGNLARTLIKDRLREEGYHCDEVVLYKTEMPVESEEKLFQLLKTEKLQIVTFTSSSTVKHFMHVVDKFQLYKQIQHLTFACIGPVAKKTAEQYHLPVAICAEEYTMEGLLKALIAYPMQ